MDACSQDAPTRLDSTGAVNAQLQRNASSHEDSRRSAVANSRESNDSGDREDDKQ